MKKSIIAAAVIAMAAIAAQQPYAATQRGGEVEVNISTVRIPSGFDTSDPVAIVSGVYPNSCYSWNRGVVDHLSPTVHEIKGIADVKMGMCLMVLVPFSEEIAIGKLERGTHTLRFVNGDGTFQERKLVVD